MDSPRPDPDALLARVAAAEVEARRGKLKVFLGAAPGVGKTFAMLNAARELARQGVDVVIGLVETHGRADTEALLEGLAVLPRRRLDYKGRELTELDLDALLARRPALAVVDELAHSNVPGARHERRWQDIAELLDAGIDVFTTVNIQHLESLNDVVFGFTGVRVRETVPDAFFDRVADLVLVDLPPRELIERLRQGKVYVPDRARAALDRFFSPSNLTALRELALQTVADRTDSDLRELGGELGVIRRRVLVAIDGHEQTEYLVRMARRIAERRQAPWTVVHVDTGRRGRTDPESLQAAFQLAQRLGGTTAVLRGADVVGEILRYAQRHGVSSIVIGRTRERPWARMLGRTVAQRLLATGARFDLTIINTPGSRARSRRHLADAEKPTEWWRPYLEAGGVVALAVLLAALLEGLLPVASLALVFTTAVIVVGVRSSTPVALFAAVLSFLVYNFFFTEPRLSLHIAGAHDVAAVFSFLLAAVVCGQLAARQHAQVRLLTAANEMARALGELGERLTAAADEDAVFQVAQEALGTALGGEVRLWRRLADSAALVPVPPDAPPLAPNDLAAATWVADHGQPAGRFTGTLAGSAWWFLPLLVEGRCLGVVGLRCGEGTRAPGPERRALAAAMVQQVASAAERTRLAASLEAARVAGETERLRTALLSSVSHDLRSPLAAVIGSASSLSAYGDRMSAEERSELLAGIRSEGERLDRYIQNLLDMTRLGSGPMKLERDWVDLEDIVSAATTRLAKLFPATTVITDLGPELPPLWVHPALIEQALFNLLENAAKVSPPNEPLVVRARRSGDRMTIEVVDRGPGIPDEERRRVFDLFYSVARGDRGLPRGTGLGLTIVRGLIGAHGGKVEALPGDGGCGSVLRFTLPLLEPPTAATAEDDRT
ncbi:MAG: sensor histidine kinase KdpD [Thermoanaerobaculia bacterium]|nr:sensor histidine kinase KdpD [Thermoanaerobaculia bacterium]